MNGWRTFAKIVLSVCVLSTFQKTGQVRFTEGQVRSLLVCVVAVRSS